MKKELNDYLSLLVRNHFENVSVRIWKLLINNAEDANNRGVAHSGLFITSINEIISKNVIDEFEIVILEIEKLINVTNRKLSNSELIKIKEILQNGFKSLIQSLYENHFFVAAERIGFNREQGQLWKTNLEQQIINKINHRIESLRLKDLLTVDSKTEKVAKRANIISFFALLISVITIAISFIK